MRDYVELVKVLRGCSDEFCKREKCPRFNSAPATAFECIEKLDKDAADAIEELLAAVPHWISVGERLPKRYETVLLNIQTYKDSYVTIGDYEPNELRFRDFGDRNNQVYCGDVVTHWASLPRAPREEI